MKYDWSKCNNFEWKTKNNNGFMKIIGTEVTLFTYKQNIDSCNGNPCYSFFAFFHNFERFEESFPDLKIVPRNPSLYDQFKAEDMVEDENNSIGEVLFSTPSIVVVRWGNSLKYYEQGENNFCLIPTGYERQLALEMREDIIHFKPGDRVIGRDENSTDITWDFGIFKEMSEDNGKPIYVCRFKEFTECLPFNEDTCKLLGTTNDYGD